MLQREVRVVALPVQAARVEGYHWVVEVEVCPHRHLMSVRWLAGWPFSHPVQP